MKRNALILFFLVTLVLLFLHPIQLDGLNIDLGHHLLVGEIISNTHTIPTSNIFAYTAPNYPYVLHAWLAEVIFYQLFVFFGYNGLIIFAIFIAGLTFILLLQNPEIKNSTFASFVVGIFYLGLLAGRTEVRPELLSMLILSVYVYILYTYKRNATKLLYFLPLLQLLWVNIHIYFIVGVIVIALFLFDSLLSNYFSFHSKKVKMLGIIFLCCVCVSMFNPQFLTGALYPLTVFSNYGMVVNENANIVVLLFTYNEYSLILVWFIILCLLAVLLNFYRNNKVKVVDLFLFIFFMLFFSFAIRNISLFVVGSFIPAVKAVDLSMQYMRKKYSRNIFIIIAGVAFSILSIFFMYRLIWTISHNSIGLGVVEESKEAIDLIIENDISGPIYNTYNLGNYLEYKLYPKEKVFVNGSPEAYPKEFFTHTYYPSLKSSSAFIKADKQYHFNVFIYDHGTIKVDRHILVEYLINSKQWRLVYLNNRVVVFVKNIPKNIHILQSHIITEENIHLSERDLDTVEKIENLSVLFYALGWEEKRYEMSRIYLEHDPNNCVALKDIAMYMKNKSDPNYTKYVDRYNNKCWLR